ncbi:undecaprenyl-phosphate glucose phosphotransferase [Paenibacillus antibioticophila]|uniref:Undecaprenyl-phosphate glucose phosphotransferase n=1 Tax=Paenibacillus antibioticophila TaxID=1274374 RepID=A0A919XRI1_9BACL|nr:undecaprenyl-phosphate glucose phosphotransferase [Paenibacillus antibioticophila]GIO35150.1 undecaprenyl-phosphate glucose phosphotransferase [Paenibacillus antibioticophila]
MIRKNQRFLSQMYMAMDFVIIQLSHFLAWWLKFKSGLLVYQEALPLEVYSFWSVVYGFVALMMGLFFSLYAQTRKTRYVDEALKLLQVHASSLFLVLSLMFLVKQMDISRMYLGMFMALNIMSIMLCRYILKRSLKSLRRKGFNKQFVLILGAGTLGCKFYDHLQQYPELGYEVIGFLDDRREWEASESHRYKPIIGKVEQLETILQAEIVDDVVLALPLTAHSRYARIIAICEKEGVRTLIIPDFFDFLPARPYFDNFAGMPLINVRDIPLDLTGNRLLKRAFDIVFSLFAIIITSPVMLLTAIGIKLTSKGPIIFKQERVGLNRRHFHMYKFRSMKVLPEGVPDTGWTTENDPRRTRFGAFLRKTSLDELPQFFNVLAGHMSVVGPRPERPYYVEQFREEVPKYMVKHHVRPGITGYAQANGLRGDTSIEERIEHDIFYIENWSILLDIKIIVKTVFNGFMNKNAY